MTPLPIKRPNVPHLRPVPESAPTTTVRGPGWRLVNGLWYYSAAWIGKENA